MPYQMHTVEAGGCQIEYAETGSGPAVVYLHGSGGFRFDQASFGALSKRYRLLAPAMPGFDASSLGSVGSAVDMADVMAGFIRIAAGGSAHVIGESFGGRIAAWLAIRHPEVVQTLTLAAPAGTRQDGGDLRQQGTPEELQRLLFGRVIEPPPSAEQQSQLRLNFANAIRFSANWDDDMVQQLHAIGCPTLLLRGTDDQTLSLEAVQEFQRRIPGSKLVEIQDAPHVISAAVPERFAAEVADFVDASGTPAKRPARKRLVRAAVGAVVLVALGLGVLTVQAGVLPNSLSDCPPAGNNQGCRLCPHIQCVPTATPTPAPPPVRR